MTCERLINPITNPNPVLVSNTRDSTHNIYRAFVSPALSTANNALPLEAPATTAV
jgi:hypothetical protein